jgi:hypothetical protein
LSLHYKSGEEIRKGDRVLINGVPGHIEFVADPLVADPETSWYVEEFGGGVGCWDPRLGRSFDDDPSDDDDLVFVSRCE